MRFVLLACLFIPAASPYSPHTTATGTPLRRTDAANIKFLIHESTAPGMLNAGGAPIFAAGSDPIAALQAAAVAWSNVATATVKFAPLETSAAANDSSDDRNAIVFLDTPENRSVVGSALAVTVLTFLSDGSILETDIVFNPAEAFSTNLAPKTSDLQSVAMHEMGHALGASHSGVLAATMFQVTALESNSQTALSADDAAFLTEFYPAPGSADVYGTISGKVQFSGAEPVRGALVMAADTAKGVLVGTFSSVVDGTYSLKAPRGVYLLYAEPADGPVFPANLYTDADKVSALFQTGFYGGLAPPQLVDLAAADASADIAVEPGTAPFDIQIVGTGRAAGSGDAAVSQGVTLLTAGQSVDLILAGPGLDAQVTQDQVRLLGPGLAIRPDSIRLDRRITIGEFRPIRLTVDVERRTDAAVGSIVFVKDGVAVVLSGSLLIVPAAP